MSLEKNHRLSVKGFALTNTLYVESFPHPHSLHAQIDEFREAENVACAPLADPLVYMGFGFVPNKFAEPVLNSTNHNFCFLGHQFFLYMHLVLQKVLCRNI
jgi:hypothetical protein